MTSINRESAKKHYCITAFVENVPGGVGCMGWAQGWHTNEKAKYNSHVAYFVMQLEHTTQKRVHIQMYIELRTRKRMKWVKKMLAVAFGKDLGPHIEARKGKRRIARLYCMKEDKMSHTWPASWQGHQGRILGTDIYESGEFTDRSGLQGKRTDLHMIHERIATGTPLKEIAHEFPSQYLRLSKHIKSVQGDHLRWKSQAKENVTVPIHVLYGDPGTGKDETVLRKYGKENVYVLAKDDNDAVWWDGYEGQKVLLIADFYGWLRYGRLLNLASGRSQRLNIKGGTTWSMWDEIWITSNQSPTQWYKSGMTNALASRILTVTKYVLPEIDKINAHHYKLPETVIVERQDYRKLAMKKLKEMVKEYKTVPEMVPHLPSITYPTSGTSTILNKMVTVPECSPLTLSSVSSDKIKPAVKFPRRKKCTISTVWPIVASNNYFADWQHPRGIYNALENTSGTISETSERN